MIAAGNRHAAAATARSASRRAVGPQNESDPGLRAPRSRRPVHRRRGREGWTPAAPRSGRQPGPCRYGRRGALRPASPRATAGRRQRKRRAETVPAHGRECARASPSRRHAARRYARANSTGDRRGTPLVPPSSTSVMAAAPSALRCTVCNNGQDKPARNVMQYHSPPTRAITGRGIPCGCPPLPATGRPPAPAPDKGRFFAGRGVPHPTSHPYIAVHLPTIRHACRMSASSPRGAEIPSHSLAHGCGAVKLGL